MKRLKRLLMGNELETAFLKKYPGSKMIVEHWKQATDTEFRFDKINRPRLEQFVRHLKKNVAASTARQYAARLKATLNVYSEEVKLPKDFAKVLSVKDEKPINIYLTEDEVRKLRKVLPKSGNEMVVLKQFLISVYTGCRHTDISNMSSANIREDGFLEYVAKKTKEHSEIPVHPYVAQHIDDKEIKVELSLPTYNNHIRNLCKRAGVNEQVSIFRAGEYVKDEKWKFVTSHTARRTFATNLFLRGVDSLTIADMMGHTDARMTEENYICCRRRPLSELAMEFFEENLPKKTESEFTEIFGF